MAMGSVTKQVRSRIMIIMEQLHETESLPTIAALTIMSRPHVYQGRCQLPVPGTMRAAGSGPPHNGNRVAKRKRCSRERPRGEFGVFAFVTEPILHRELQPVGASLQ